MATLDGVLCSHSYATSTVPSCSTCRGRAREQHMNKWISGSVLAMWGAACVLCVMCSAAMHDDCKDSVRTTRTRPESPSSVCLCLCVCVCVRSATACVMRGLACMNNRCFRPRALWGSVLGVRVGIAARQAVQWRAFSAAAWPCKRVQHGQWERFFAALL